MKKKTKTGSENTIERAQVFCETQYTGRNGQEGAAIYAVPVIGEATGSSRKCNTRDCPQSG
ncbi:hypothetical protein [Maricaulis salignorans]|uniref:hypothetical protein n=1 Tax=Maricaulis salignorans TaxID=144026 RepID=UPI0015A2824D|nr:hypothetical protein [Maricaulis salignorans]